MRNLAVLAAACAALFMDPCARAQTPPSNSAGRTEDKPPALEALQGDWAGISHQFYTNSFTIRGNKIRVGGCPATPFSLSHDVKSQDGEHTVAIVIPRTYRCDENNLGYVFEFRFEWNMYAAPGNQPRLIEVSFPDAGGDGVFEQTKLASSDGMPG
jgi:hypothetical protein